MNIIVRTANRFCFIFRLCAALVAVAVMSAGNAPAASVINVNYGSSQAASLNGMWSFDPVACGSALRVAPVAYVSATWNDCHSANAVVTNLLDSIGRPTGVGLVTKMEGGLWDDWTGLANARLLKSAVIADYTNYQPVLSFTGLVPGHSYDLFIASLHNNDNNPQNYRVGTVEQHVVNHPGGSTNWAEGRNYIRLAGLKPAANGTMTVEAKAERGGVIMNGFQLVDNDVPTPKSPAKDITSFTFGALGSATIAGTNITINVLWGTKVTERTPTFTLFPGANASPPSGTTRNFSRPVTYTVTAEDGSTKKYCVTVTILPKSPAKQILGCKFGKLGSAVMSGDTITMTVPASQPLTKLAPTFLLSPFATISPASGSANDFTRPVTYTVAAQDGSTKAYRVTVLTYGAWAHSASFYILTTHEGANLPPSALEKAFPILVRLNAGNFTFSHAKPAGEDIRFSTAAGLRLPYQIEEWDAARSTASIWVRIPAIVGNARQELKMYWGKADAATESCGAAVFNAANGFVSVIHLNETLLDEVGSVTPSNVGTTVACGMIGKSRHITMNNGIHCGDSITTYPYGTNALSSECWFRAEQGGAAIVCWGRYATRFNGPTGDGNLVDMSFGAPPKLSWASDGPPHGNATTVPELGKWYHVAATYENKISRIFVNGTIEGCASNVPMSMYTNIYMRIGGGAGSFNFAGNIDEVRVSRVARSIDWMRLEYQNQNPLQTLVGPPMQAGSAFSVQPAVVKVKEGSVIKFVAQAGGAQKLYWICKRDGKEAVIAVDQFTLNYDAGRVVGDQSFVIQLKAVYPTEVKTKDIPVTITEAIADPEFTLSAQPTWDGRTVMTVTTNIANWPALLAAGVTNLTYRWSIASVAVGKAIVPGNLVLLRSLGSGQMTVTLVLENGGVSVTNRAVIDVKEPATDAWVVRTPDADETPVNNQFYARDDRNEGTLYYNGTLSNGADSVFLKVYADDALIKTETQKPSGNNTYAFAVKLMPGLIRYRIEFGTSVGGNDTVMRSVTNIVCGDAYLLDGQSNTVADNNKGPHGMYKNDWIRSFGGMSGGTESAWGTAIAASALGDAYRIGYWGMALADRLVKTHGMPICIINGAVGGTRVDQHQRNESDPEDQGSIYGRILARVKAARLTHGIRGAMWHQGENNSGAAAPTGDWDYKSYQQYFVDMSAAWKQDYPNIRYYYVYQIWPLPCSMGPKGAQVREAQRTLPRLYSHMALMSTIGITNSFNGRGLCHFDWEGYEQIASLMSPLVERDNYGVVPKSVITPPDLMRAYYSTAMRDEIALEFDQAITWSSATATNFYLDRARGQVVSGSASGNVVKLHLAGPSTAKTIDYVDDNDWDGNWTNLLWGANGIAACTFCDVPIE